jgi:molecular chaperone GrpE
MNDNDPLPGGSGLLGALDFADMVRAEKERHREQMRRLLLGLLPVLDNLSALELRSGRAAITEQMVNVLAKVGLEPFDVVGQPLDLSRHDVLSVTPTDSVEPDTILEEDQRGYLWNGQLLRRARVIIAGPANRSIERTSP